MPQDELTAIRAALLEAADPGDAEFLQRYFKTGPGEYGEGDRFHGIRVPRLRRFAGLYRSLTLDALSDLLRSPWHEERMLALFILAEQHLRGSEKVRDDIHRLYLAHTRYINNWDLVDCSAVQIVGAHLGPERLDALEALACSELLWERRIAVLATFHWIRNRVFHPALHIAAMLLQDEHDLIHKAVGWMLREIGKREWPVEEAFLREHYRNMPRTMLRYAIERLPEPERRQYLKGLI